MSDSKNIVLCSDGTGNRWGVGAQTNVSKLYQAVDTEPGTGKSVQLRFYDNGVGTSTNRYLRALTGAFGFGLQRNVRDLYEFLASHWEPGDKIYLFGFSRGAATVRAFAGMLQEVGLIWIDKGQRKCKCHDEKRLDELIDLAIDAYEHRDPKKEGANAAHRRKLKDSVELSSGGFQLAPSVDIQMIGAWDTVSALGFPKGPVLLGWLFKGLEKAADWLFPHSFYNYQLDDRVKFACHALAIDDERRSFRPTLWNELSDTRPERVEQVWFTGMHSNVGGGYPRTGLSSVALSWMMAHAQREGLRLHDSAVAAARDNANPHGKMHDSRDGLKIFYRYMPRDLVRLAEVGTGPMNFSGEVKKGRSPESYPEPKRPMVEEGSVRVHRSVLERLEKGTARYAPGFLPQSFVVIDDPPADSRLPPPEGIAAKVPGTGDDFKSEIRKPVLSATWSRGLLYHFFLYVTLSLAVCTVWLWRTAPKRADDAVGGTAAPEPPKAVEPEGLLAVVLDWFKSLFASIVEQASELLQRPLGVVLDWTATVTAGVLGQVAELLKWLLPKATEEMVALLFVGKPIYLIGLLVLGGALFTWRGRTFKARARAAQEARLAVLESLAGVGNLFHEKAVGTPGSPAATIRGLCWKILGLVVVPVLFVGAARLSFETAHQPIARITLMFALPCAAFVIFRHIFDLKGDNPKLPGLNQRKFGYNAQDVRKDWLKRDLETERRVLRCDLLFPVFYGGAFAASVFLGADYLGWEPTILLAVPMLITIVADWTENSIHLLQIPRFEREEKKKKEGRDPEPDEELQEGWIRTASVATVIKYWGVALGGFGFVAVMALLVAFH